MLAASEAALNADTLRDIGSVHGPLGEMDLALDFERKSSMIREALLAEAPADDVRFRSALAKAHGEMGDLCAIRGTRARSQTDQAIRSWREARSSYERSRDLWLDLERRGVATATAERDAVTQRLAKVDANLAKSASRRLK